MGQMVRTRDHDCDKTRLQAVEVTIFDDDVDLVKALADILRIDDATSARVRDLVLDIVLSEEQLEGNVSPKQMLFFQRDRH